MIVIAATRPFARFLKRIGNSTFHINSAYIGLEWIARGKGKPEDLEINWPVPKDLVSAVAQSRQLLHTALLGYVFDSVDSYLRLIAGVSWLKLTDDERGILRKAVTRPGKGDYALWERLEVVLPSSENPPPEVRHEEIENAAVDLALVRVLSAWRNKKVHDGLLVDGEFRLDSVVQQQLIDASSNLSLRYGGLSAAEMLQKMEGHSSPRRKK